MKNIVLFTAIISMLSLSFVSNSEKPKNKILTSGEIIVNKWWLPNGNIYFSIEKNDYGNIKSVFIKGSVLSFSASGVAEISNLGKNKSNKLFVSDYIDSMVSVVLEDGFGELGGIMSLTIYLPDSIEKENFLISKTTEGDFNVTNDGKLVSSFIVLYSVGSGMTGYKIEY